MTGWLPASQMHNGISLKDFSYTSNYIRLTIRRGMAVVYGCALIFALQLRQALH
jgi:hypothetical protein